MAKKVVSRTSYVDPNKVGRRRPAGTGREYIGTTEARWTCGSCGTTKIGGGTKVFIKGKYDLLVRLPDGSYMIIDIKLSKPDEEKITKYQSQLWSYVYAFENPVSGVRKQITKAGPLVFYPDVATIGNDMASLTFPPTWLEVPIDRDAFTKFIGEVSLLLEGPTPQENSHCDWCKYRHLGEALSHPELSDIPF